ncbi:GNAT family N-acetyltransferase [Carboxylicivirga sp. RSCT41]|uniref:GNAT family N-acetyltransferase n=1 Tax=Carboxylicivirga agarovorans TaxID=3417570 RepID=UPI003D34E0AA
MKAYIELRTERLILRPVATEDAHAMFNYRSDSETNKYQGWIPDTINDVYDFLRKVSQEINRADTWFQLAIIEAESSMLIGDLGIHFIGDEQAELGCTLAKNKHGNGYAAEAMRVVMDYLFNTLGKHRIIGSVDPQNIKSIGLLDRLGFRKEAHFLESLLIDGKWVDDVVYATLKREWNKQ